MNLFEFFGCLGGCMLVFAYVIRIIREVLKVVRNYQKYKDAYEYHEDVEQEKLKQMGFKTEKERMAIEAKLLEHRRA